MERKNLIISLRGLPLFYSGAFDWSSNISKAKLFSPENVYAQIATLRDLGIRPNLLRVDLFKRYERQAG
jgi:hypothetical protein